MGAGAAFAFLSRFEIRRKSAPAARQAMQAARPAQPQPESPEVVAQRRVEADQVVAKAYPHLTERDRGEAVRQIEHEARRMLGRVRH